MKKLSAVILVVLAVGVLQACNHAKTNSNNENDSENTAQDTSGTLNLAVDKVDSDFAVDAANGNLAEIQMGKLAVKNGRSKKVKNYGLMMIKDHGNANMELMALSKSKNLNLPQTPDTSSEKMIAELAKKTGDDFDKAYISSMIADHQEDVNKFTGATKQIQDPDLQKYAITMLPVLKKHLDAINAIHDSMP